MPRNALLFPMLLAALAAAGCHPRVSIAPELRADAARLLEEVEQAQALTERVQGSARVKIESPDVNGTANAFLAAERGRLHVELLDFFGNPVAVLIADGDRFGYFDARRRTWYRGDATAENVSRFLPIALPPWELATILRGSAPILEGSSAEVVDAGREGVDLVVVDRDLTQTLRIGEDLTIRSSRVRATADATGPSPHYDLTFERFTRVGTVLFPHEVRLDAPRASARVQVGWKADVEVNGEPRPELFRLEPPAGAEVVDLPPGGAIPEVDIPLGTEE